MSGTAADLLIIYEAEAEQWASYMRSVFSGPVAPDDGICCYDIATVTGRKSQEDFLCLVQYRCKLLILSRGLLEALCPLTRFFLARVLTPPGQVVVLLCGVPSLAPLLEQVPLQGDDYLQISSEQEAHEYTATMADIVRRGAQTTSMEPVSRRASGPEVRLEKKLSTGAAAAKASLLVVPSRVSCEAPGEVYLLLQECVGREAEVEFTAGKHKVRVKTTSWSDNTLSVNAPKLPAGSVGVTLYCGGVAKSKSNLQYYSALGEVAHLLSKVADPVDFMCQAFQVCSVEELDETLAGCLMHKLPTGGLRELQLDQGLEAGASGASREDIPTLLHFVAQHGLRDLGGVLLQCPGAQNALCSANRYGQTPLDLAQAHGHTQLHILLKGALNAQSGEEGEDSSVYEMMSTAGNPKARPPEDPLQASGEEEEDQEEEEEEDPYAPLGVNDEEYDTILSPSNSLVIANRPPAPTPRPENMPIKEDRTPFIAQVFQKKMPQPDSGTLYSVPLKQVRERESISSTYDTFVASQSPPGLDELISLQQQVKLGTLSVDDALNRFSQWQRLQKGVDSSQQEKLRQMRASLVNYRDDDDSVYDKINIIHHTPNVAVKDCRRGSQPAESDFYSKPLKGQQSNLFWKADKR